MSLNKVLLIGRLGRDPETRYTPNGDAVCNFSVATDESWKDQHGQKQTRTEWHHITMYRKLAEIAAQYLKKGNQVYLEGKIQSEKYTGKDGVERTAYKIICDQMKMLGGNHSDGQAQGAAPSSAANPPPEPPQRRQANEPVQPVQDIDDDIPLKNEAQICPVFMPETPVVFAAVFPVF